jgi:ribosomal silencing factor RsfS
MFNLGLDSRAEGKLAEIEDRVKSIKDQLENGNQNEEQAQDAVTNKMLEQKATTKYMVFVEGRCNPKKVHDSYDSAEKEAKRLSAKEIGCNVMVLSVVKTFKSKVIVEEKL